MGISIDLTRLAFWKDDSGAVRCARAMLTGTAAVQMLREKGHGDGTKGLGWVGSAQLRKLGGGRVRGTMVPTYPSYLKA